MSAHGLPMADDLFNFTCPHPPPEGKFKVAKAECPECVATALAFWEIALHEHEQTIRAREGHIADLEAQLQRNAEAARRARLSWYWQGFSAGASAERAEILALEVDLECASECQARERIHPSSRSVRGCAFARFRERIQSLPQAKPDTPEVEP